jgi:LAS superfamily LD-carboxypeptidase LdcB
MLMLILYESTRKLVGDIDVARKRKKLTKRQTNALRRHSRHHTKKHMKFMRAQMRKGKTFTQAHKAAMKKVGR